jgi:Fic family protein
MARAWDGGVKGFSYNGLVTSQADLLYKGFPDFSAWGDLTPSDIDLWNRFSASLSERRQSATPETLKSAVEVAVRAAALDTGAIEGLYTVDRGFTMTVAFQSLAWEQAIEERGAGVRELFEAQLQAYELVLDAVTRNLPISEAWIRALHEKLCAPQKTYRVLTEVGWQEQELPKGQYKTRPNHVRLADGTFHAYAPVERVPEEMHRLLEQIRTPEFEAAHPILQASYCHYAFVVIHPFADGNGRVARALASIFFYRAQSIPLVIFANQRIAYLDALQAADLGDYKPILSFFENRGIDTMQLVAESLSETEIPNPEIAAARITNLLRPWKGLSHEELDALALRLLSEIIGRLTSRFKSLELPETLSLKIERAEDTRGALQGYRRALINPKPIFSIRVENNSTVKVLVEASFRALVAEDSSNPFTFLIEAVGSPENLEIRLEDVYPELAPSLDFRLAGWTQRLISRLLTSAEQKSRDSLKKLG